MALDTTNELPPAESYPKQSLRLYIDLSVFWFALSALWSGMITMVIQNHVLEIVGEAKKDIYLGPTLAIGALISTIVCLIVGTMSDRSRWGLGRRRPYIIVGTVAAVPAVVWLGYVESIGTLILSFCLIQVWVNVATSPYQAMIPDMVPREKHGTASAYMGMSSLLGQLSGFAVYGFLTAASSLPVTMAVVSAVLVLCMVYTVLRLPERPAKISRAPKSGLAATVVDAFRVRPRDYPDFMRLIASRFMINMGFYTCIAILDYYVIFTLAARDHTAVLTWIMLIATASGLVGNFPAGLLSDRVSKKAVVYVSNAVTGLAVLWFALTSSVGSAMAAAFVFGAGLGAFMAVDWAFATNLLPERDEAKYMGVWHIAFTVPQVIAPLIGLPLAYVVNNSFGSGLGYRAAMFLSLGYFVLGTLMIRPIRERVRPWLKTSGGEATP